MTQTTHLRSGIDGAISMVMVFCAFSIVAFAALAIDTYRAFVSGAEKQHTADFAALAALEAFIKDDTSSGMYTVKTPAERFTSAKERAESIVRGNKVTATGKDHMEGWDTLAVDPVTGTTGESPGYLQAGIWYTHADCTNCPCGAAPCFEPCTDGDCGGVLASAMRVSLRTKDSEPILSTFGRVIGIPSLRVVAEGMASSGEAATASITPIHTVLLIDAGRGALIDNTLISERGGADNVLGARMEPISTMLDTSYHLLNRFVAGARVHDRISWIVFDEQNNHGGLRTQNTLISSTHTRVADFISALDPANPSLRAANNLLPLPDSGSNISAALTTARNILASSPTFSQVQNNIVLITNGLADDCNPKETSSSLNCPKFLTASQEIVDRQFHSLAEDLQHSATQASWTLNPANHQGVQINLDIVPVGNSVHTVLRQNPGGGSSQCMNEVQMRSHAAQFASIRANPNNQNTRVTQFTSLGTAPFPRRFFDPVEWLYSISRNSGASWLPVLPPCNVDVSNSCSSGGGAPVTTGLGSLASGSIDTDGRLFCQPAGLSIQQQVDFYSASQIFTPAIRLVGK